MEVTDHVPVQYWSDAYKHGEYLDKWDYTHPAQELVGALVLLDWSEFDPGVGSNLTPHGAKRRTL